MPRWSRISLRILGGLVGLIILAWLVVAVYVNLHKKELLASITDQLNENINGTLTIESMEPTLVRGFPGISLALRNVVLRDTMYHVHHHDLLQAKEVSITVNAFSILRGSPRIRDITVKDGNAFLFTDSTGYSNTNLFVTKAERNATGKKTPPRLNHFFFDHVHFVFEHKTARKNFDLSIDRLEGLLRYGNTGWTGQVKVKTRVGALDFNTNFGPFLKGKYVTANLELRYDKEKQVLHIPPGEVDVEGDDVTVGGTVYLAKKPVTFQVEIAAKNIGYEAGRSSLSRHIADKLAVISLKKPVSVQVSLRGSGARGDIPLVRVRFQVENNTLVSAGEEIEGCSFSGYFYNKVNPGADISDINSIISVDNFRGSWHGIAFRADSLRINNLISPVMSGRFLSDFDLAELNPVVNNRTFQFDKGRARLDLVYKGGIRNNDTTQPYIIGQVKLQDAGITYLPRNLVFTNSSITLDFRGSDLFVNDVRLQHGGNVLLMDGSLRNFLNLYYTDPAKILLDWHIRSPQISLEPYRNFFAARKKAAAVTAKPGAQAKSINRLSQQLDLVLERGSVHMQLKVDKIGYRKFNARNLNADISLSESGLVLHQVAVQHAGGQVQLSGSVDQQGARNTFALAAKVDGVQVNEFFHAFSSFGLTSVTEKNIQGQFYTTANVSGSITDGGELVPGSMNGTVNFELKNGVLMEFDPLKNIGKYIFRRRNLSYIRITSLKDQLDIHGNLVTIHPLQLASDAINADVAGTYSFSRGTDINIDVPLRNPKKDELILDADEKEAKRTKGIVVHLNVSDGDDGKMKIRLVGKNNAKGKDKEAKAGG